MTSSSKKDSYCLDPRKCLHCGKDLPYSKRFNKFFSSSCAASYNNTHRNVFKTKCSCCGSEFESRSGNAKMCPECGNRGVTKCKFCGRDFLPKYKGNVFCSSKCSQDYRKDIWKKDTIKYIDETGLMPVFNGKVLFNETNRKAVKMYLIAKFGHRCSICGTDSWLGKPVPLVVDHTDGDPFNHSVDNFRLVCGNCNMQLPTFTSKNYGKGRKLGKLRKKN